MPKKVSPLPYKPPKAEQSVMRERGHHNNAPRIGTRAAQKAAERTFRGMTDKERQAIRDAAGATNPKLRSRAMFAANQAGENAVDRVRSGKFGREEAGVNAARGARVARGLVRRVSAGLLSPAGLAEEVAGRAAQVVERKRFMKEAGEQGKPSKKSGMRKPYTKA